MNDVEDGYEIAKMSCSCVFALILVILLIVAAIMIFAGRIDRAF